MLWDCIVSCWIWSNSSQCSPAAFVTLLHVEYCSPNKSIHPCIYPTRLYHQPNHTRLQYWLRLHYTWCWCLAAVPWRSMLLLTLDLANTNTTLGRSSLATIIVALFCSIMCALGINFVLRCRLLICRRWQGVFEPSKNVASLERAHN